MSPEEGTDGSTGASTSAFPVLPLAPVAAASINLRFRIRRTAPRMMSQLPMNPSEKMARPRTMSQDVNPASISALTSGPVTAHMNPAVAISRYPKIAYDASGATTLPLHHGTNRAARRGIPQSSG